MGYNTSDYIVHEQYVDQAALDFHSNSTHGARYFPRMRALLDKIDVEYFDSVVVEGDRGKEKGVRN